MRYRNVLFRLNCALFTISGRSVSLVGEGERKLLKEIVKQARNPVKSRLISPEIITKFKKKLSDFSDDVQDILKQEKEEKEVGEKTCMHCGDVERPSSAVWT